MPQNITDALSFTSPMVAIDNGDAATGANFLLGHQGAANRTAFLNNSLLAVASTVSAGGTTALTVASAYCQVLTGSANQTFTLPDETTIPVNRSFEFINQSSGVLVVNDSAGTLLFEVPPSTIGYAVVTSTSNAAATGNWAASSRFPIAGPLAATTGPLTSGAQTTAAGPMILYPGKWRISAMGSFSYLPNSSCTFTAARTEFSISKTPAVIPTSGNYAQPLNGECVMLDQIAGVSVAGSASSPSNAIVIPMVIEPYIITQATVGGYYCVVRSTFAFTGGAMTVGFVGSMYAEAVS